MMNRGQRQAMLLMLDRAMLDQGSWCGETHLQKGTYLLQSLFDIDSDYSFILYKHGPFSFEVRDTLSEMEADGLIEVVAREPGYGPSYLPANSASDFLARFPKTVERLKKPVDFVASWLGNKGVAELERLATALFIRLQEEGSLEERASKLVKLKPHIDASDALSATCEIDKIVGAVKARA